MYAVASDGRGGCIASGPTGPSSNHFLGYHLPLQSVVSRALVGNELLPGLCSILAAVEVLLDQRRYSGFKKGPFLRNAFVQRLNAPLLLRAGVNDDKPIRTSVQHLGVRAGSVDGTMLALSQATDWLPNAISESSLFEFCGQSVGLRQPRDESQACLGHRL